MNDKSKKYILRRQGNVKCYEKILSNNFVKFLGDYNRCRAEFFRVYLHFNGLSNDISHFAVAQNFIISTCLSNVLTINFLEDGNRYKVEIFRVK